MDDGGLDDPAPTAANLAAWSTHLGRPVPDPVALRSRLTAGPTLSAAFSAGGRGRSDRPALTVDRVTLTHGEVARETTRVAAALGQRRVGAGTPVLIVADTDLSVVTAYLGALRVGAVVTMAHPSYTPSELADLVVASGAELALATGTSLGRLVDAGGTVPVAGLRTSDRGLVGSVLGDGSGSGDGAGEPAGVGGDSLALRAFTSGSTGRPKAVPLTHRNLLASIRGAMEAWRWSAEDVLVHCLPVAHQHGLGGVHAALLGGSHTVILPRFDPEQLVDVIARRRATVLFSVPAIYARLLTDAGPRLGDLRGLRLMTSGSAPLPPATAAAIEEVTGQVPLERYGTTESGLDVSNPYAGRRVPGTVGVALPGVEVALVAGEGAPVADGETGEVVVRGPQVFAGYAGATESPSFLRGWFRTGDVGEFDPSTGHLRLVGRVKDLIISGGMNVYPMEVERALREIPGVVDAAVIGLPSPEWGEQVVAFVVRGRGAAFDLGAALEPRLAPYKRPKQIVEVEEIPRTEMGKLRREELSRAAAKPRP